MTDVRNVVVLSRLIDTDAFEEAVRADRRAQARKPELAKISDLTASKITAGSLTATVDITSGRIRTAASGQRVEIDVDGIRLYNSGGVAVVDLNADTGDAIFQGKIRTAASGQRIEIDPAGSKHDRIQFFAGSEDAEDAALIQIAATSLELLAPDIDSDGLRGRIRIFEDEIQFWCDPGGNVAWFEEAASTNDTALVLDVNYGSGGLNQKVTIGASNSGGSGFRVLRVPNS